MQCLYTYILIKVVYHISIRNIFCIDYIKDKYFRFTFPSGTSIHQRP